jgi:cell wall-associated NlpC family hydrolase
MHRFGRKLLISVLSAALFIGSASIDAMASSNLPNGGVSLALAGGNDLKTVTAGQSINLEITDLVEVVEVQEEQVAEAATVAETLESMYENLVIAQVRKYVNVRSLPSEQGEIIGKLYNNSVGTYLGEEDGWYLIQSGSVTGYVKGEYCVTGADAAAIAEEVGTMYATVNTTTLKVRSDSSLEASVIGLVPLGDDLVVTNQVEGWAQVDVEEGTGWVSTDYVDFHIEFVTAESKEEEEARLAKEAKERAAAQAAASKSSTKSTSGSSSSGSSSTTYTVSGEGSELGKQVAEYALQFVGNPYVYGGTSLTNGCDCSGFVMSVYANYGVSLPHSSKSDRTQGYAVEGGIDNAQPGDLICYSGHVAMYIGNGQIVHASNKKTGIIVSSATYRTILAIRRIF